MKIPLMSVIVIVIAKVSSCQDTTSFQETANDNKTDYSVANVSLNLENSQITNTTLGNTNITVSQNTTDFQIAQLNSVVYENSQGSFTQEAQPINNKKISDQGMESTDGKNIVFQTANLSPNSENVHKINMTFDNTINKINQETTTFKTTQLYSIDNENSQGSELTKEINVRETNFTNNNNTDLRIVNPPSISENSQTTNITLNSTKITQERTTQSYSVNNASSRGTTTQGPQITKEINSQETTPFTVTTQSATSQNPQDSNSPRDSTLRFTSPLTTQGTQFTKETNVRETTPFSNTVTLQSATSEYPRDANFPRDSTLRYTTPVSALFTQVTPTPSRDLKVASKLKVPTEFNKAFSLDVISLLIRANRVSFVREVNSLQGDDFQRDFVSYLSRGNLMSFVEFDSNRVRRCRKCNATDEQIAWKKFVSLNHIIVVLYDTFESFNKSLSSEEWSIFDESSRSFFIIVVISETLNGTLCSSSDFNNNLKKVSKELLTSAWKKFQILETIIYYPYICGVEKILKFNPVLEESISIVSNEDLKKDPSKLIQSYSDLNGYPLKVKLFGRVPTSVKNMSKSILNSYLQKDIQRIGNVGGIDGFTLANLVKYLNFTVEVSEPADGIEYGHMSNEGIYVGTLGDVIYKRADISFNGRFLKDYNAKDIEFTTPIYHDQFCVLVPKALRIPTWRNIFLGFSMTAWYMIILTASIAGVLWWLMKAASLNPEPGSRGPLGFCIHFMDMCLLIASQPIFLPFLGRERIFVAGCLVFNIIFSGVFQGYLNTAFSTTSHYPDINTLESLDESGLPIATSSRLSDIFGTGSLQKKIKSIKTAAIDQAAEKRDVSAVERRSDARLLIELKYLANDGEPLLHVVNECPRSYYLTYIVYRGYPFLQHIDRFIQRITEGGLNEQWYDFTMYSIVLHHRSSHRISSESLKKLTLVDVQTAFFALVIGLVSSSVVFICEYVHFRIENKRKLKKRNRWSRLLRPDMFVSTTLPKYQFNQ